MTTPITFGSVCSGIEAASVAWHPLGWRAVWLAEIEPFPCAVLAHHYPDVPNLGDMTKIAALVRDGFVPAPDVFCGGTPCQAFSVAGLRNSLDDARGNLSLTFCEIANEIDARRRAAGLVPAVVFWENVPGVLSTRDNAFGCFLAGLAGEDDPLVAPGGKWANAGCVFGPARVVAWRTLDAQFFGVAQRRRRVFVVASAREGFDPAAVLFEFEGVRRDSAPRRQAREDAPAGTLRSTDGGCCVDHARALHLQPVTSTLDASYGRLQGCSGQDMKHGHSHLVPLSVALRGREGGGTAELGDDVETCLRASTGGGDKPHVLAPIAFDSRQDCVSSTEVFGALGSSSPQVQAVAFSCKDHGADAAVEIALTMRAMGHSGSHANAGGQLAVVAPVLSFKPGQSEAAGGIFVTEDFAPTLQAQNNGSTAVPAVCVTGDITHTLKAEGFDASEGGTGCGQPIVTAAIDIRNAKLDLDGPTMTLQAGGIGEGRGMCINAIPHAMQAMAVRRLTPRECERLQGFEDDYTLIPYGRRVSEEKLDRDFIKYQLRGNPKHLTREDIGRLAADGPRYKALGNSWAIPVVRWLGTRIDRALCALDNN